jgi:hypothetical protein
VHRTGVKIHEAAPWTPGPCELSHSLVAGWRTRIETLSQVAARPHRRFLLARANRLVGEAVGTRRSSI